MKKKILLCLLLYAGINFSQEKHPKIGLVLSGGGAKGFAHVGVLKEIDKAGLQIDYIAGTSMGAIIGGLYASGYTALEIEKLIKEINFTDTLRDKFPRKASPFFEKEYEEKTSITLPVTKGKIGIPKSVSKGQSVLSLFYELLDSTEEINDFSKLPIPFFCIGTDVETGSEILLEKGSLPLAIRASGSFPTLLDPVEVDGKLLVDGGITNNFPISIMKSKGMDIIIGVDVQGNLKKKENLTSVIAILNQIVSYQTYNKSNEEKKLLDFYIHPDVYDYSVVDFDKKDEILQKGDKIGAKFAKAFKELADKQIKKKDKKNVENFKYRIAKRKIDSIEIKG
ncbi:MAG: patatin-like phospholipase family protein, partial [Flavobacteriaceae bacterium]|nr:patatin-like phospholipase family protein [Flavobacteriaceae bacterium]